jgi:ergothioneine biosynthesis protein EgtB
MTPLGIESDAQAPSSAPRAAPEVRAAALCEQLMATRRQTARLCEPMQLEDYGVQSMPDASPVRWHLAHTTWFFETFVLERAQPYRAGWDKLFNSYYESVGPRHPRPERGLLTRPTTAEVWTYREAIEGELAQLLAEPARLTPSLLDRVELGIHHEQQHQELILTDLQHALSRNPLRPAYRPVPPTASTSARAPVDGSAVADAQAWLQHEGGVYTIGTDGDDFAFDNERPNHKLYLEPFAVAARPVTAGAYLGFMADGGYERPEFWLSEGWALVNAEGWSAPLYWERDGDAWQRFSLYGVVPIDPNAPVCHVSYYEADAFARWAGLRLPSEAEWELVAAAQAAGSGVHGQFVEAGLLAPLEPESSSLFGGVWQWTQSPYTPYPGFITPQGALGEYNAKFMINQLVLRGGSCFTPHSHMRATYRNFFPASARWQMTGFRLAR